MQNLKYQIPDLESSWIFNLEGISGELLLLLPMEGWMLRWASESTSAQEKSTSGRLAIGRSTSGRSTSGRWAYVRRAIGRPFWCQASIWKVSNGISLCICVSIWDRIWIGVRIRIRTSPIMAYRMNKWTVQMDPIFLWLSLSVLLSLLFSFVGDDGHLDHSDGLSTDQLRKGRRLWLVGLLFTKCSLGIVFSYLLLKSKGVWSRSISWRQSRLSPPPPPPLQPTPAWQEAFAFLPANTTTLGEI